MGEPVLSSYATIDVDRERRQGLPEIIYGPGKRTDEISGIAHALLAGNSGPVLATRIEADQGRELRHEFPSAAYDETARLLVFRGATAPLGVTAAVVSAGTADGPVASEAASVASAIGMEVTRLTDVGVAGLHRLLQRRADLVAADVVIVVAGMEAALASVVGGLVGGPVVAVPTSTGYGASLEGVTALLGMMSSCAAGLTVVNIDSGFSAALAAFRLSRSMTRRLRE